MAAYDQVSILQTHHRLQLQDNSDRDASPNKAILFHFFHILRQDQTSNKLMKQQIKTLQKGGCGLLTLNDNVVNRKIQQGVQEIISTLASKIAWANRAFGESPILVGSSADGTKLGPHANEFDYVIPLTIESESVELIVSNDESYCSGVVLRNNSVKSGEEICEILNSLYGYSNYFLKETCIKDLHPSAPRIHQTFETLVMELMPKIRLPQHFTHAGYQLDHENPVFSGFRHHGPAVMLQFYYGSRSMKNKILVTVDLVTAFVVNPNCLTLPDQRRPAMQLEERISYEQDETPPDAYIIVLKDFFSLSKPHASKVLLQRNKNFLGQILGKLKLLTKHFMSVDHELVSDQMDSVSTVGILLALQSKSTSAVDRPRGMSGELYEPQVPASSYALKAILFYVVQAVDGFIEYDEADEHSLIRLCLMVVVYNYFTTAKDTGRGLKYSWELNRYNFSKTYNYGNILPDASAMIKHVPDSLTWSSLQEDFKKVKANMEKAYISSYAVNSNRSSWGSIVNSFTT